MYKELLKKRRELNLGIEDMGKIIKRSPATYYKKESGTVTISLEEALAIAKALNTPIEKLFR